MNNQYQDDKKRLAELLKKYTGISVQKIIGHIDKFGAGSLLSGSTGLCNTETQRQKLGLLFEFKNVYEAVKSADSKREYVLDSVQASKDYFINYFADIADREHVVAALLDSRHKIITTRHISAGTISSAVVDARDIAREALFCNATGVIAAHNHPSGHLQASMQDIEMTNTLKNALGLMNITLHDHVIVGGGSAMSLANEGHISDKRQPLPIESKVAFCEKSEIYASYTKQARVKPPSVKKQIASLKASRALEPIAQPIRNTRDR
jgi:DNA repair protein RadC